MKEPRDMTCANYPQTPNDSKHRLYVCVYMYVQRERNKTIKKGGEIFKNNVPG